MKSFIKPLFTAASVVIFSGVAAADESELELFEYTDGNLILGFQAEGGVGSNKNVFLDLGPATAFRDNGNQGVLGNIGTTLEFVFGSDWNTRSDVFFGVIANLNPASPFGVTAPQPVNGDPSATFYVSKPAATPGTGFLYAPQTFSSGGLASAGTKLGGMEDLLRGINNGWNKQSPVLLSRGLYAQLDGAAILDQAIPQHSAAWNGDNTWSKRNPTPGAAFDIFTGGLQQNFDGGGVPRHVDLQRILPTLTGANPSGVLRGGSYITTITISPSGEISAAIATPSSTPFQDWIGSFNPPLTNPADREPDADPDNDGISNLMEFVLNGNPTMPSQSILPTLDAAGANFVFNFTRRADSAGEVAQVFEYSTDLMDWTTNAPIAIPTTPGVSGFVTVGATTGSAPNEVQDITISIPKGMDAKLFGRLKAEQP